MRLFQKIAAAVIVLGSLFFVDLWGAHWNWVEGLKDFGQFAVVFIVFGSLYFFALRLWFGPGAAKNKKKADNK